MTTADPRAREAGQILPLFALLMVLLLLPVSALAVDGGLIITRHAIMVGEAQAAAEAGSQAVDQTALSQRGVFQLCSRADGGPSCGNGVGDVAQVVGEVVAGSQSPAVGGCTQVDVAALAARGPSGCELAVLSPCGAGGPPLGVEVLIWSVARMPLAGIGPLGAVELRASAVSWLAHGIGAGSAPSVVPQC